MTLVTGRAQAQDPTPPSSVDSLRQRLDDLEALVQMLRDQAATESEAAVRTRSRVALELHGRVLTHALYTSNNTNNADLPLFVELPVLNQRRGGGTLSMRQSTIGFSVQSRDILGADFIGDLDADFFGGQLGPSGGRHFPLLRLRTARAALMWDRVTLMAGQDQPLITDVDPLSLATIGTPGFANAGNLWLWLPQLRVSYESPGSIRFGAQAAVLAPVVASVAGAFNTGFDAAERSRWPSLQARVSARWGEDDTHGEIGMGVHQGRILTQSDSADVDSRAIAMSAIVPFARVLELRGEWFTGQAVGGLGGGGIGQSVSTTGDAIETTGGWAQLNWRPNQRWILGAGLGMDDPHPDASVLRRRNAVHGVTAQWWPTGPIVAGVEWRRIETTYAAGMQRADHINFAFGFEF